MLKLKCRIIENETEGWDVYFPGHTVAHVSAAALALARVCSIVQALPEHSILNIQWEPRTSIGRSVVKVITE